MSLRETLELGGMAAMGVLIVAWYALQVFLFIHVDFRPASHGVSIGTPTSYCSLDYPQGWSCQEGE